ncbi:MAG: PhnD/SsuA/transferrin family substrate-binding protein [bacterium]|nr:PhnD/SsuA/transferrin family substrate-binding protein [bacterium]MDE0290221.1 PhnD/SsuA/transferrin family substrate-binding protein [bacterium]MDE0376948.1 PhnD/SsuA/transferrin family substrate-binding protein [bacterium]
MNTPVEAPLRAATYLGDNTVAIMADLVRYLSEATGIEVVIDRTVGRSTAAARQEAPNLDLVWMCGYMTESLISAGRMSHTIVAVPVFAGHGGPVYHSVIVTRPDGPRTLLAALDTRLAVNEIESWSGFLGLKAHVEHCRPGSWFTDQTVTGSHRASIRAVAERECDVASIDVTIWDHVVATEPEAAADLRTIDRTVDWPAPPFSLTANLELEQRDIVTAALLAIRPSDIASLDGVAPANSCLYRDVMPVRPPGIPVRRSSKRETHNGSDRN